MKGRGKSIRYMEQPITFCTGSKREYYTEEEAQAVADYQGETNGVDLYVYECEDHWHLSSRP